MTSIFWTLFDFLFPFPPAGKGFILVCPIERTTQAAPVMLSLQHGGTNPALPQKAFDGFYRWDSIRVVFGALGDFAAIWSLVAVTMVSVKCENHSVKSLDR